MVADKSSNPNPLVLRYTDHLPRIPPLHIYCPCTDILFLSCQIIRRTRMAIHTSSTCAHGSPASSSFGGISHKRSEHCIFRDTPRDTEHGYHRCFGRGHHYSQIGGGNRWADITQKRLSRKKRWRAMAWEFDLGREGMI